MRKVTENILWDIFDTVTGPIKKLGSYLCDLLGEYTGISLLSLYYTLIWSLQVCVTSNTTKWTLFSVLIDLLIRYVIFWIILFVLWAWYKKIESSRERYLKEFKDE
jgi:hypothetical protein